MYAAGRLLETLDNSPEAYSLAFEYAKILCKSGEAGFISVHPFYVGKHRFYGIYYEPSLRKPGRSSDDSDRQSARRDGKRRRGRQD